MVPVSCHEGHVLVHLHTVTLVASIVILNEYTMHLPVAGLTLHDINVPIIQEFKRS